MIDWFCYMIMYWHPLKLESLLYSDSVSKAPASNKESVLLLLWQIIMSLGDGYIRPIHFAAFTQMGSKPEPMAVSLK